MKKSYISILLLAMVMILAISAVSAAEDVNASDSDLQAVDEAPVEGVALDDVDVVAATDDTVVGDGPDDGDNFTSLSNKIKNSDKDFYFLEKDYTAVEGDQVISIERDFVLLGDNHKIDAKNLCEIFEIKQGVTFILQDVTLLNGRADNGGAIVNNGNLTLKKCIFENNTATNYGGAIYNLGVLDIDDCTFKENTATYKGGAIYSEGTVDVSGSTFDSNSIAKRDGRASDNYGGAAIYNVDGTLTVDNSVFKNNLKDYKYGITEDNGDKVTGAITTTGTVRITNSNFTGNKGRYGSSVTMNPLTSIKQASILLDNCKFTDNIAYQGGAVNFNDGIELEFTINNCWFENNAAYGKGSNGFVANGGALNAEISHTVGKGTITGTTFINNQVQDVTVPISGSYVSGGAVMFNGKQFTVENSVFINNVAERGSAIHTVIIEDGLTVDNVTFESNKATVGGAIWAYDNIYVKDSRFINNNASEGGAIYFTKYATASTITNSNFTDNNATNGGAIYIAEKSGNWAPSITITDSKFDGNTATGEGNAIYNLGALKLSGNDISKTSEDVYTNSGSISPVNVTVTINGADSYLYAIEEDLILNATITDVDGNLIEVENFRFKLTSPDGATSEYSPYATYLGEGKYNATFNPEWDLNYIVSVVFDGSTDVVYNTVTARLITIKGTFRDLQNKVNYAIADSKDLNLTYNFAYTPGVDDMTGFDFTNGITIDTSLTINGNNHIISGNDAVRVFNVVAGTTLTLNNVTITNGKADNGGAIYVASGAELDADYVNFTDNTATYKGGAVYSEGTVKVNHTVFDNNNITTRNMGDDYNYGGAAIYNVDGTLTVDNSVFTNNVNDYTYGTTVDNGDKIKGAITSSGTITVTNSNFTGNKGRWGSSITMAQLTASSVDFITIDNCNFTDNLAYSGGAVHIEWGNFKILNSWFENNRVLGIGSDGQTAAGGALTVLDWAYIGMVGTINGTTFKDNYVSVPVSESVGGAIFFQAEKLEVENSIFIGNTANDMGGAVYHYEIDISFKNVTFESNSAGLGGAIYGGDNSKISDSRFVNNNATYGGAVYYECYSTASTVTNSNFTGNNATYGGAIYINIPGYGYDPAVSISDSKFDGNTATGEGNAIYNNGELTLTHNTLSKQQADIVSNGEVASTIIIKVMNNGTAYHFANIILQANVTDDNYNVMKIKNLNLTVNDTANTQVPVVFNPETQMHEGIYTPIAAGVFNIGATYITTSHLDITDANITISRSLIDIQDMVNAANAGDTINLTGDYAYIEEFDSEIVNGIVVNKTITIDGKGFTISGSNVARIFNITNNAVLTLTNVTLTNGKADEGAAVYVNAGSTLKADYVNFTNNIATYKGGAVYSKGTVIVNHTVFDGNDIEYRASRKNTDFNGGAAIYNSKGNLTVDYATVKNNVKNYGIRSDTDYDNLDGAITSLSGTVTISHTEFRNNSARYGSAILISSLGDGTDGTFTIDNCQFYDNLALAGAIQVWDRDNIFEFTILNSWFENNTATGITDPTHTAAGGALTIINAKKAKINDTTFKENKVTNIAKEPKGGAINIQDSNIEIDNCTFEGNHVDANGGAINVYSGSVEVNNSKFINNDATINGGAINIQSGTTTVENSNFTGNTATNGSAIYSNGVLTLSGNNVTSGLTEIFIGPKGTVVSEINVIVLEGQNWTTNKFEVKLNATVKDDNGNYIKDASFNFTIAGNSSIKAVYNDVAQIYEANYTLSAPGVYLVNVTYPTTNKLVVETYNITCIRGTFTDLYENYIKGKDSATLTYNFTYFDEFDSALKDGIVIDHNIDIEGNGVTISGNESARIFLVKADLNINNVTLCDANTSGLGGAICIQKIGITLKVNNSNFTNNVAKYGSSICDDDYASTVYVDNCIFDSNDNDGHRKTTQMSGAPAIFNWGTLIVNNSVFSNNLKNFVPRGEVNQDFAHAAIWAQGTAKIYNSNFTNNKGSYGGAICSNRIAGNSLLVDNCRFINNIAYDGGAIQISEGTAAEVKNSYFENNTVLGTGSQGTDSAAGGAICINGAVSAKIVNCIFKDNKVGDTNVSAGGAIAIGDTPIVEISDCTFENNSAEDCGGAIDISSKSTAANKVTVTNCNFTDNSAEFGGAIRFKETNSELDVSKSNFTGNTATNGSAIYSNGVLTLSKNNVTSGKSEIEVGSKGTIVASIIYATFLGDDENNTIAASLKEVVHPYATLTDDNGNAIYDVNFNITVDGVELNTTYDEVNKVYTATYTILTAGDKIVSTKYNANKTEGKYAVPKANVTVFTVTVDDILDNENATVVITLLGIDGEKLNATVTVILNNTRLTIEVINGTGNQNVSNLTHGTYPVVAELPVSANYNGAINSTAFYVKTTTKIIIEPVAPVEYGTPVTLIIHLYDGSDIPLSGSVVIAYDKFSEVIAVNGGDATFDVTGKVDLVLGENNFTVFFAGDNEYNASENSTTINVKVNEIDPDAVIVDIPNTEYGDNITVTITSPVDGNYTVNITGTVATVEVINHTGSANITALDNPGIYNATVSIDDSNYSLNKTVEDIEYLVTPEFTVTIEGTYPNATITITGTPGNYHVLIGLDTIDMTINPGETSTNHTIDKINAGNYTAYVSFDARDEFYGNETDKNFTVNKAEFSIVPLLIGDKVVESPINITFTLPTDITGNVYAFIDGVAITELTVNETTGVYTAVFDAGFDKGGHIFSVEFTNDPNYNDTYAQVSFIVEKVTPEIVISDIAGNVGDTVEATVNITGGDATGYILYDGTFYIVKDGQATIPVVISKAGIQSISVNYTGDDKYFNGTGVKAFNAGKGAINSISTDVTNGTEFVAGKNLTVEVTVDPAVNGAYTLWIDGVEATEYGTLTVEDGKGSFIILAEDLPAGEHNITVQFIEDDLYYASENATYVFTVVKTPTTISTNVTNGTEFVAGKDLTVEVTVDPAVSGAYTLWIDGVEATEYGTLTVYYGVGGFIILAEDLPAGEHNITVQFIEDDLYYASENATYVFTVVKTPTTISTNVTNGTEFVAGKDLTVEVTVDPAVSGTYTLWIDGEITSDYGTLTVYNGVSSFIILAEDLPAGEHNITVQFNEDDSYYASENATSVFTVVKTNTTISTDVANGTESVAGKDLTVEVTVDPAVSGTYTLWIDGKLASDYGTLTVYNGVGSFIILAEDLPAGEHNITVQFIENDLYYASENATSVFTVVKSAITIETSINNDTEYFAGNDLTVEVSVNPAVSGTYTLWIDGVEATEYGTLILYKGVGSFIILAEDLTVGNHNVTVQYNEDELFNASENATYVFKVVSTTSISTDIVNGSSVDACEDLTVEVTVDPAVNGTYTLWIDGVEATEYGTLTVYNGVGSFIILAEDLLEGPHSISVQFVGDEFYKTSENVTYIVVAVKKDSIIKVNTGDVVIDEPLVVNITIGNLTGDVTVTGNVYDGIVTLTNGEGTFTIARENMTYGSKSIVVIVSNNAKYADNSTTYNFDVEKAENYTFDVNITVPDMNIRENLTFNVTLPEDANGKITVKVDGKSTGLYADVVNGNATVFVPAEAFTAGRNNTIEVTFNPDGDKYNQTTATKEIYVNKLDYDLIATADNIELDQNATIVVYLPDGADGNVFAELQGIMYPADANGMITIENLTIGTYTAYVVFVGDSVYKDNQTIVTFNVTKVEIPADKAFNITTPENATAPEFTINLPEDATGFLLLDVNGTQTYVPLVNGTATAKVPSGFAPGNYTAVVTYTGDNKYDSITTTQNITVESNVPDNAFTIPDAAKDGEPLTYSISLPSDAKGYLEVDVDGKKYVAALEKGSASVTVPGLSAGSHNVTVTYTGDGKYSPVSKSMALNVPNPVYAISKNKNVAAVYSAKASYKVLVTKDGKAVGAGETVTFKYNGKTYTAKTDSKGYATLKLNTKVKVGKYTITATYKGVTVKNKVTIKQLIKAKNAKIKKSKKINKIRVKTYKVNGKYLKGKKLKLKITLASKSKKSSAKSSSSSSAKTSTGKAKYIKAKINKKGVAIFKLKQKNIKKLKVGKKYQYTVVYGKDTKTKKLTVKK